MDPRGLNDLTPQIEQQIGREKAEREKKELGEKSSRAVGGEKLIEALGKKTAEAGAAGVEAVEEQERQETLIEGERQLVGQQIQITAAQLQQQAQQNQQQQVQQQQVMIEQQRRQQEAEQMRKKARAKATAASAATETVKNAADPTESLLTATLTPVPVVGQVWGAKKLFDVFKRFLS